MATTQESLLGQPLTTPETEAQSLFDQAVMALANNRGGVARFAKKSIEADPGFVMGHCLMGYVLMLGSNSAYMPMVRDNLDKASKGVEGVTPWERSHVEALRIWSEGRADGAAEAWEGILREYPIDLLALDLAHLNYFWLGDSENLRDVVARVRPSWDENTPGYSFMLGMHGFGMEECGQYGEAEATAREAVEMEPTDIWATHAVAHVMEMQGRHRDGIAYLDGIKEHWSGSSTCGGIARCTTWNWNNSIGCSSFTIRRCGGGNPNSTWTFRTPPRCCGGLNWPGPMWVGAGKNWRIRPPCTWTITPWCSPSFTI